MTTATKALTLQYRLLRLDGRCYDLATTAGAQAFLESENFDHCKFPEDLDVAGLLVSAAYDAQDGVTIVRRDVKALIDSICDLGRY